VRAGREALKALSKFLASGRPSNLSDAVGWTGKLMPLLIYEASVHCQRNSDAGVGIAIRPITCVAFGECVNGDRV
jgi:hypothetical protein